ncbi:DUF1772 domain-containing protein [Granulicella sp. 5B5]|uniref:DUF1772 domain-containing protein n=1 Tax=Granulicella sp. 5B5 TaxID=1617967 RepID=UPI0015F5DE44|nr:DUF1772 domain-containing protein [Granulicella sp. 5B5]QMV18914.1 DUF1772 domain-containing protein [Granulicella sp. 5B5]
MFILDLITTLSIGMLIGVEFCVSVFINPILDRLDPLTQAHLMRDFAKRLGGAMPFWYGFNLLLLITESVFRRQQPNAALLYTAVTLWALTILMTVLILVPINNRMMQLEGAISEQSKRDHGKWDTLHRLRVVALAAAAICAFIAIGM